jgi:DNA invertase Pin-like site-specific DNA recombinase
MKNAVIYSRVSTSEQDTSSQISNLKQKCKGYDYKIVKIFDEQVSGMKSKDDRPQLKELLDFVKVNDIHVVVIWELSRIGRRLADVLNIVSELNDLGIALHSFKEPIITIDEKGEISLMGRMMVSILTTFSEFERESIVTRSQRGLAYSSEFLNRWTGGNLLPYGYKRNDKKELVIDAEEATVIRRIFNLYLENSKWTHVRDMKGTKKIATVLNSENIPTRYNKVLNKEITDENGIKRRKEIIINGIRKTSEDFDWVDGTIYTILKNPIYKGERRYKGRILRAPSIIDGETWNKVNELLSSNNSKKGIHTKFDYLLANIELRCGECGLTYFPHKRSDGKDNRYICITKRNHKKECKNYGIGINKLNNSVWKIINSRKKELVEHIQKTSNTSQIVSDIEKKNDQIIALTKKRNENLRNERFLVEKVMKGRLSQETYDDMIGDILNNKELIDKQIELSIKDLERLKELQSIQSDPSYQIRTIKGDRNLMKDYLNKIINKITIYPIKDDFKISESTEIKGDKYLLIQMELRSTTVPVYFIISQRSRLVIHSVKESDFDFNTYSILGNKKELKSHVMPIVHHIED